MTICSKSHDYCMTSHDLRPRNDDGYDEGDVHKRSPDDRHWRLDQLDLFWFHCKYVEHNEVTAIDRGNPSIKPTPCL